MTNRFSTDVIQRQGARKSVITAEDKFINVFQNSLGFDKAREAANIALSDRTLETGAINSEQYQVAKSFFNRRGISESAAISMALILLDVAKITKVSVMKLLVPIQNSDTILFDFQTLAAANLVRPVSSKQGILVKNDNSKSYRKRNILA